MVPLEKPMSLLGAVIKRLLDPVAPNAPMGSDKRIEDVMGCPSQLGRTLIRRVDIITVAGDMRPHYTEPLTDIGER